MDMVRDNNWFRSVFRFYAEGFRSMTVGKTLWIIIAVKLFVIFVVLRLLFFPDFVASRSEDGDESGFVADELVERAAE